MTSDIIINASPGAKLYVVLFNGTNLTQVWNFTTSEWVDGSIMDDALLLDCHLALIDTNGWYQADMPSSLVNSNVYIRVCEQFEDSPAVTDSIATVYEYPERYSQVRAVADKVDNVPAALKNSTGYTANDNFTFQDIISMLFADRIGKVRIKTGFERTYEVLDPDDDSVVVMEFTVNKSNSPYRTTTKVS